MMGLAYIAAVLLDILVCLLDIILTMHIVTKTAPDKSSNSIISKYMVNIVPKVVLHNIINKLSIVYSRYFKSIAAIK